MKMGDGPAEAAPFMIRAWAAGDLAAGRSNGPLPGESLCLVDNKMK